MIAAVYFDILCKLFLRLSSEEKLTEPFLYMNYLMFAEVTIPGAHNFLL